MKTKLIVILVLALGIGLGIGSVALLQTHSASAEACSKPSPNAQSYQVMIMSDKVDTPQITAKLCDTITFTNMDNITREIAFGPHENHVPYDGIAAKVLTAGQSFTVTLNQAGSFHWHDHIHDVVQGYFTVKS